MRAEALAIRDGRFDEASGQFSHITGRELDAIIREHGMDLCKNGCDQPQQGACGAAGLLVQLDESEFRNAIESSGHLWLTLFGSHLGDIDVSS